MPTKSTNAGGKVSPNRLQRQRKGLLAKVHIARKDLGLSDEEYQAILMRYNVKTAAALAIIELEDLVKHFKSMGWKQKPGDKGKKRWGFEKNQVEALRDRAFEEASHIDNGEIRLAGLVKKICGVDDLRFCQDAGKLKQLIRALRHIRENYPAARSL